MLVQDEMEGCMSRKIEKKKLSKPHSSSLIDFDGDCMSDLFLTINDVATGKNYYEIYIRREKETSEEGDDTSGMSATELRGLNTYCLVTREEIPSNSNNLFHFADVDRDAMVDMIFFSKNDQTINVYYNKLSS